MSYRYPYDSVLALTQIDHDIHLDDHLNGFSKNLSNSIFNHLSNLPNHKQYSVIWHNVLDPRIYNLYSNLQLKFSPERQHQLNFQSLHVYNQHPELTFVNFLCSFNGSSHVSRHLLTACLDRFGFFDPNFCSKNFQVSSERIDGHIRDFVDDDQFYLKFFLNNDNFGTQKYSFGWDRFNHSHNIYNLENQLTQSFLHLVSETMATSYYPFVTEKFLYSIVTRGLFLAYAQPGWHEHLEKYYGFKKYTRIFDYRFDTIQNPVERLVELMSMIAKFSVLSSDDWRDLYEMEHDTIEYNYEHYFSKHYLRHLESI